MKEIKTYTTGYYLICDDEDFDFLRRFRWSIVHHHRTTYATTKIGNKNVKAEILLLQPEQGVTVDHIDHNGLNVQRQNLRLATNIEQQYNTRKRIRGIGNYKGISKVTGSDKWAAQLMCKGIKLYLGCYDTQEEAAKAYDKAALEHFGEFAHLNFPERTKV